MRSIEVHITFPIQRLTFENGRKVNDNTKENPFSDGNSQKTIFLHFRVTDVTGTGQIFDSCHSSQAKAASYFFMASIIIYFLDIT